MSPNNQEDWFVVEKYDADSISSEASDDNTTSESNRVAICQKCGVEGYTSLLIYCDVCHVAAEHVYCLDTFAKIDTRVENWTCGECGHVDILSLSKITLVPTLLDEQIEVEQPRDNCSGCNDASEKVLPSLPKYALPIIDPVWRGSFEISGREYGPLVGHISNKACLRTWQAANVLPSLLRMELPSPTNVWPNKKFTSDDIALFFFSDNRRERSNFMELGMDLALKFVFDNAELLIFSSDRLPKSYRKFHGARYLWGVFRKRKVPASSFVLL